MQHITLCLILSITLTGCGSMQLAVSFSPEMQKLREGEREFEQGNYQAAEKIFQEISTSTESTQTRNTALYDLACARIMTASDSEKIVSAINLLESWQPSSPGYLYVENPIMVVTALKSRTGALMEDKIAIEEERDNALSRMRKTKKTIAGYKKKIADLNSQLQTLQYQIKELEAIDYKLQEKKSPL